MAVNKTAGVTKVKVGSASKKAAGLKKAAPTKAKPSTRFQEGEAHARVQENCHQEDRRPRRPRAPS